MPLSEAVAVQHEMNQRAAARLRDITGAELPKRKTGLNWGSRTDRTEVARVRADTASDLGKPAQNVQVDHLHWVGASRPAVFTGLREFALIAPGL